MPDDTSMLKDVEWSYFIDLEGDKLEVYEGETLLKAVDFADLKESFLEGVEKDTMEEWDA